MSPVTCKTLVARLLPAEGSNSKAVTEARLVSSPPRHGVRKIVTEATPRLVRVPKSQFTTPFTNPQLPIEGAAPANDTSAGTTLVNETAVAVNGPALLIERTKL